MWFTPNLSHDCLIIMGDTPQGTSPNAVSGGYTQHPHFMLKFAWTAFVLAGKIMRQFCPFEDLFLNVTTIKIKAQFLWNINTMSLEWRGSDHTYSMPPVFGLRYHGPPCLIRNAPHSFWSIRTDRSFTGHLTNPQSRPDELCDNPAGGGGTKENPAVFTISLERTRIQIDGHPACKSLELLSF